MNVNNTSNSPAYAELGIYNSTSIQTAQSRENKGHTVSCNKNWGQNGRNRPDDLKYTQVMANPIAQSMAALKELLGMLVGLMQMLKGSNSSSTTSSPISTTTPPSNSATGGANNGNLPDVKTGLENKASDINSQDPSVAQNPMQKMEQLINSLMQRMLNALFQGMGEIFKGSDSKSDLSTGIDGNGNTNQPPTTTNPPVTAPTTGTPPVSTGGTQQLPQEPEATQNADDSNTDSKLNTLLEIVGKLTDGLVNLSGSGLEKAIKTLSQRLKRSNKLAKAGQKGKAKASPKPIKKPATSKVKK